MTDLIMLVIAMLGTGVLGGLLAGALGVGGGIVIVPMLEFALAFAGVDASIRMHIAVATSLATIIPTSISSSRAHHRRGAVDLRITRVWGPWIFIGSLAGAWVASRVDSSVLAGMFACLAIIVAIRMILPVKQRPLPRDSEAGVPNTQRLAPVPGLIGFLSSMIGIGGGSLSVPVMTLLGEPIHRAVGTAALFGLLIAVPGTLGFMIAGWGNPLLPAASIGFVNLLGFALIAPATVLAAPLGAHVAHALNQRQLGAVFGTFLMLVSIRMAYRAITG